MTGTSDQRGGRLRELGESISEQFLQRAGRVSARIQERRGLATDLLESDDAFLVVFDAPGATGSDVQVRYHDGAVLVRIDRFRDFHEGYDMRFPGRGLSLDGEVELPEDASVDPDSATAVLRKNGTLEVEIPKTETHVDIDEDEADDHGTIETADVEDETGDESSGAADEDDESEAADAGDESSEAADAGDEGDDGDEE